MTTESRPNLQKFCRPPSKKKKKKRCETLKHNEIHVYF